MFRILMNKSVIQPLSGFGRRRYKPSLRCDLRRMFQSHPAILRQTCH